MCKPGSREWWDRVWSQLEVSALRAALDLRRGRNTDSQISLMTETLCAQIDSRSGTESTCEGTGRENGDGDVSPAIPLAHGEMADDSE